MAPELVDPKPAAIFTALRSFDRLNRNACSTDFHAVVREPDARVIEGGNPRFARINQFPQRLSFPAYECDREAAGLVIVAEDVDSDVSLVSSNSAHWRSLPLVMEGPFKTALKSSSGGAVAKLSPCCFFVSAHADTLARSRSHAVRSSTLKNLRRLTTMGLGKPSFSLFCHRKSVISEIE
ncbi:hypothetical protein GOC46_04265 [Sinorhizobium meliloti]|nr:hypothetical protein [Sinorhizobium meliloti]MDX0379437.1 hypothetical protein [Sinorhizobium meliloti]